MVKERHRGGKCLVKGKRVCLNPDLQNWSLRCLLLAYHAPTWSVREYGEKMQKKFISYAFYMSEVLWSPCSVLYLLRILSVYNPGLKMGLLFLYGYLYNLLDDSWCCGNYCWFTFALWSGCCSASFQYFVIDHLVITTVQNSMKLPPIYWLRHLPGKGRIFVFTNRSESSTLLKTNMCFGSILSLD